MDDRKKDLGTLYSLEIKKYNLKDIAENNQQVDITPTVQKDYGHFGKSLHELNFANTGQQIAYQYLGKDTRSHYNFSLGTDGEFHEFLL